MKEETERLLVVHFMDVFESYYEIKEDLLIKNLSVYGSDIGGSLIEPLDFVISRKNGVNIISPIGKFSKYVLLTERLIKSNIVYISSDNYDNINKANFGDLDIIISSGDGKNG